MFIEWIFYESLNKFTKMNIEYWPVNAAAECDEEVGEGGDLLKPLGGLRVLTRVELTQLPGVGHPADAVTQDEQTHNGQADLGLAHLREKVTCKLIFYCSSLYLIATAPQANIVTNNALDAVNNILSKVYSCDHKNYE